MLLKSAAVCFATLAIFENTVKLKMLIKLNPTMRAFYVSNLNYKD